MGLGANWSGQLGNGTITEQIIPTRIGTNFMLAAPDPNTNFADTSITPNNLSSGWSLVAIGQNRTPRDFVNEIAINQPLSPSVAATSLTSLWAWDSGSSSWYFYAPSLDNSGELSNYIASKGYLDFVVTGKTLGPTTGFWVNHP